MVFSQMAYLRAASPPLMAHGPRMVSTLVRYLLSGQGRPHQWFDPFMRRGQRKGDGVPFQGTKLTAEEESGGLVAGR